MINPYEVIKNDFYEWEPVGKTGWKEKVWLDVPWTKRLMWAIRIVVSQSLAFASCLAVIISFCDWQAVIAMFVSVCNMIYVGFMYENWWNDQFRKTDLVKTLDS